MKRLCISICLTIGLASALFAGQEKAESAAPKTKPSESPEPDDVKNKPSDEPVAITIKNKSSFQMDAGTRSPFWPIGFKPIARVAGGAGGTAMGDVPPGAFLVTSITLDGATRFAIINGKTMGEGQIFGLQVGTQIYQVTVKQIEDGRVILGRGEEEIVVPLRRKEAPERPPEGASRSPSPNR
jgi:hypothetical protein